MSRNGAPPWSDAEVATLRRLWWDTGWPELLAALPRRGRKAICRYAYLLGLRRNYHGVGKRKQPDPLAVCPAHNRTLPACPCVHVPGSAEKIEVLARRLARGEHLWHPDDGGNDD